MTPTTTPEVGARKARLRVVGRKLSRVNDERDALYAERLDLWKSLIDDGVPRSELAALAGVDPGAIKFALSADRKKNGDGE